MPRPALPPAMKDPLLAAVVGKLPPAGTPWPAAEREAWFDMMRQAVNVAYGPCEANISAVFAEKPQKQPLFSHEIENSAPLIRRFYVDHDGFAMCNGKPIDPSDLSPNAILWDERSGIDLGDHSAIMWKTGGTSKTPLPAGVQLRPAEARAASGQVTT